MFEEYYSEPSELGMLVIEKLLLPDVIKDTCIETIWHLEATTEDWNFNLSSALKYLWRLGQKQGSSVQSDIRKALVYLDWEFDQTDNPHLVRSLAIAISVARGIEDKLISNN